MKTKNKPVDVAELIRDDGKPRWINVDDLSKAGKLLIGFEPNEVVSVKGVRFRVLRVQVDLPLLVMEPAKEKPE